ncbi:uncharacterized protein Z518_04793 [Rhinocladiella mackenziei CBS 650.93]|uniref:Uncharacterized protein n=1 Tax=Rhinocladiella mackenziei CBS 650.93 TaxID=1442369 RepID=A0A0D2FWX6_9EURO|nr:uncharacterized protein Z518_04793 [Rhinocladiella mackenziei CBS 650.93]KIX06817.1 hypothetical protein Z518_04793 [Rhinocladiella mackenziei CBS 650.93]
MADSSAPPPPGSRAIKIPVHVNKMSEYSTPNSLRRSERYLKNAERAEVSDAGPSSLGSDQESPWSYSPVPGRPQDRLQTVASPSTQDRQFPAASNPADESNTSQRKDKHKAGFPPPDSMSTLFSPSSSPLGPCMLSSSSYKSINLNSHHDDPDEPPRLITYTKHSQGFTWNDELFLPSYMLGRYGPRGRKKQYDGDFGDEDQCPVAEIFVTDEEAEAMMP